MKRLIVVSHCKSNESILDTVKMITGLNKIIYINIQDENLISNFNPSNDDDYLCLLDIYSEKAINYIQSLFHSAKNYKIITGLNLPMALEAVMCLNTNQSLEDIAFNISESARDNIVNLRDEMS